MTDHTAARDHYQTLAEAAAAPRLRELLREARQRLPYIDILGQQIDEELRKRPAVVVSPLHEDCSAVLEEHRVDDFTWSVLKAMDR